MEVVIGADVCKGKWVFVRLENAAFAGAQVYEDFAAGIQEAHDAAAIGVDIPIGYPAPPATCRAADALARSMVAPLTSSVFTTPHPGVWAIQDYQAANEESRRLTGRGLSRQTFNVIPKILEVHPIAMENAHIFEVHPEVSFRALAGHPLASKHTWNGHNERLTLLAGAGIVIPDALGNAGTAAPDDILDAAVAAWSAHRFAAGQAVPLPCPPQRTEPPGLGEQGRPVAIWY